LPALLLALPLALTAQTVLYWDTNDTTSGAGSTPTGQWDSTNYHWNTSSAGTANTVQWQSGAIAVFSAGSDAVNAYTVTPTATLTIGGLVVQEGTPTISGGTLSLGSNAFIGSVLFGITGSTTINSTVTSAYGTALSKIGSGTLTLGGSTDNDGLVVQLNQGTVILAKTSGSSVHGVSGVSGVATGTTLQLAGTGGEQIYDGGIGVQAMNGTFDLNGRSETIPSLTGNGTVTNSAAGSGSVLTIGSGDVSSTFTGVFVGSSNNPLALQKTGGGTFALAGTGTDNAYLTASVTGGTLVLGQTSGSTAHAVSSITGVSSGATLQLAGTGGDQIYDAGNGVQNMNGTFDLNGRSENLSFLTGGGTVTNGSAGTTSTITVGNSNYSSPFTGVIQDGAGKVALVTNGNNSYVILGGINTYTGGTTIVSNSSLQLGYGAAFGSVLGNITNNGSLVLGNTSPSTVANNISGSGLVTIRYAGPVTLNGQNTYTGGTTVEDGATLSAFSNANLGTGPLTLGINGGPSTGTLSFGAVFDPTANGRVVTLAGSGSGGTFNLPGSLPDVVTLSGPISGRGGLTLTGQTPLVLAGANTYTGATTISASSELDLGNGGTSGSVAGSIVNNGYLVLNRSDSYTFANSVSGTGGLDINLGGNGTQTSTITLTGTNTFTGGLYLYPGNGNNEPNPGGLVVAASSNANLGTGTLEIDGGVLRFNAVFDPTANGRAVKLDSMGGYFDTNGHDITFAGPVSEYGTGNQLIKLGSGTLTLAGTNTFSGGVKVAGGSIAASSNANLGPGTLEFDNGGTLRFSAVFDPSSVARTIQMDSGGGGFDTNGLNITLAGGVPVFGGVPVTKTGAGSLTLSGTADNPSFQLNLTQGTAVLGKTSSATVHAVMGVTGVSTGATLQLGGTGGDQISDDASLYGTPYGGVQAMNGTFDLNGRSETIIRLTGNGTVTNTSGTSSTLTVGANDADFTFAGNVQDGAGSTLLVKTGAGGATFSGALTSSAASGLTVNSGTVTLSGSTDNSSLVLNVAGGTAILAKDSSATVHAVSRVNSVAAGATLQLGGTGGDQIKDSNLYAVGSLDGTFDLNGRSEGTSLASGSLTGLVTNSAAGTTSTLTLNNYTFYDGAFSDGAGTLALVKTATGDLTLQGPVAISGGLVVNGGNVTLGGFGDNAGLVLTVNTGTVTLQKIDLDTANVHAVAGVAGVAAGATLKLNAQNTDQIYDYGIGVQAMNGTFIVGASGGETISFLTGSGVVQGVDTLTVGAADATSTFTGQIGAIDNSFGFTLAKTGAGTFTVGGTADNNSLSVNVQSGTMVLGKTSSATVHAAASVSGVSNGATLQLAGSGGDQIYDSAAGVTNMNGTFDLNGRSETIPALAGTGTITNTAAATTSTLSVGFGDVSSTFTGVVNNGAGTALLNKIGAGTLTLASTGTFTGGVAVTAGKVQIGPGSLSLGSLTGTGGTFDLFNGSGRTLTVGTDNTSTTFAGVIQGSGGALQKTGTGTLTLTGANTFTGGLTILNGAIAAAGNANLGTGTLTLNGGALRFTGVFDPTASSRPITLGYSGGAFDTNGNAITVAGGLGNNNGSLAKSGAGTLTFSGTTDNNSLNLNVTAGTAILGKTSASDVHAVAGISGVSAGATLQLAGTGGDQIYDGAAYGGVQAMNGTFDLNGRSETISALAGTGNVTNTSASTSSTLAVGAGNTSSTFAGSVQNGAGTAVLGKIGTGTLTLSGTTAYTGGVTLSAGTVQLGAGNPALGLLTVNGGTFSAGAADATIGSLAGSGGTVDLSNGSGRTLNVGGDNTSTAFAGLIQGNGGALTKTGTGTLALTGTNTYTGATTISAGTLQLGAAGTTGSVAGGIVNNATLLLNRSNDFTFANALSGSGTLVQRGTDTVTLNGTNSSTGGVTVSTGTVVVGSASAAGSGLLSIGDSITGASSPALLFSSSAGNLSFANAITVSSQGTGTATLGTAAGSNFITFTGPVSLNRATTISGGSSDRTSFTGVISGNVGTLTIAGNRTTLAGTNTFVGNVIVNSGAVLQLNEDAANPILPLASNVQADGELRFINGGATLGGLTGAGTVRLTGSNQTQSLTLGANNANAAFTGTLSDGGGGNVLSLVKIGTGTQTLAGASSYSGGTALSTGTLAVGSNTALGSGALAFNGGALQAGGGAVTLANAATLSAATTLSGTQPLTFSGNWTLAQNAALTVTNTAVTTISGSIGESGGVHSFAKYGAGELDLTGASTYTGGTLIAAGTVKINNLSGSAFGTGAVTVASGATLTGAGTFTGAFQNNGVYSPGNSPALVSLTNFSQGPTGLLEMQIAGLTRGTGYDALNISGAFLPGGTLAVTFLNGFSPVSGATFDLFNFGSISGTFAQLDLPALGTGLVWDSSKLYVDGTLSVSASAIPEPATYAVLFGVISLAGATLRRRRQ
jgi:autotransporter-associated beta strand protein